MSYSAIDAYSDICAELDKGPVDDEDETDANQRIVAAFQKLHREHGEMRSALEGMRKQLREHVKMDVKRHYSLMVADAAAGTILAKVAADA